MVTVLAILSVGASGSGAAQSNVDADQLNIADITAPSEVTSGEQVTVESGAAIPDLPADWSAQLTFRLYVDGSRVETEEIYLTDGESANVVLQHQIRGSGTAEVYVEVEGELTREGRFTDQSVRVDRTTRSVSVAVLEDDSIGTDVSIEGAAFVAPDSIQSEVNATREDIPDVVTESVPSHAFVVASSETLYLVFSSKEPQEGYASVDAKSYGGDEIALAGDRESPVLRPIVADRVKFEEPSSVSIEEVYEHTEGYARQFVEISATHRSVSVDYENSSASVTTGVLINDPLSPGTLFGAPGEQASTVLRGMEGETVDDVLGNISRPRVVTASFEMAYWDNTPVTMSGIVADPASPAGEFIRAQQEDPLLPTDSETPILYVIDKRYDARSVSGISEVTANPAAFENETVQVETNLYMSTISTKRVVESATTLQLPPVDVVLHGGVGWEQLPDSRDDLVGIIAASSIDQQQLVEMRRGTYSVIGEVVSSDQIAGDLPEGMVFLAYDLERVDDIETAAPGSLIEQQQSAIENVLRRQVDPENNTATAVDVTQSASGVAPTEASTDTTVQLTVRVSATGLSGVSAGEVDIGASGLKLGNGTRGDDVTIDFTQDDITGGTLDVTKTVEVRTPAEAGAYPVFVTDLRVGGTATPSEYRIEDANVTLDTVRVEDTGSSPGSSIGEYRDPTTDDVDISGFRRAVNDFATGEIDIETFRSVIDTFAG